MQMPQPSALDYITIKGFKSIASIERLPIRPINVLIGANGSGKSNFIGIFSFLHAVREGHLQQYVRATGGAEQILHFGSKRTRGIEFHISFSEGINQYHLKLDATEDDSLYPLAEDVYYREKQYPRPIIQPLTSRENGREAGISDPNVTRIASWVRLRLGLWRLYHVHDTSSTSQMRKTAQLNDNAFCALTDLTFLLFYTCYRRSIRIPLG